MAQDKPSIFPYVVLAAAAAVLAAAGYVFWPDDDYLIRSDSATESPPSEERIEVAAWNPERPVELVVMAGEAGGADRVARLIKGIIEKNHLLDQPIIVTNMGGNSGSEALNYVLSKRGDPHVLMLTLNSFYTTPIRQPDLGVQVDSFTPIARLAEDSFILWVSSESNIQTIDDYVTAVRGAAPGNWRMGGTGRGQEDALVTAMLEDAYGLCHEYVPFNSGGAVARSLVKNDVQATVNNPSEQMAFYKAGKSRPLAAFTYKRIPAFPDVPTFRELGHELIYSLQQSIVAAPGIPRSAQVRYHKLFQQVHVSMEWKKYTEKRSLHRAFLPDTPLLAYFSDELEKHRRLMKTLSDTKCE